MALNDLVVRLLRWFQGQEKSKETAKNRLRLILIQDRVGVDPGVVDSLREDLLALLTKYFDVNVEEMEVEIQRDEERTALVVNVPILTLKGRHPSDFRREREGATASQEKSEPSPADGSPNKGQKSRSEGSEEKASESSDQESPSATTSEIPKAAASSSAPRPSTDSGASSASSSSS
ncbi:MAG: hypothetical protein KatS3mg115_1130 [Candidatus Poribacteria bacterium]|nr:MAG: hypothetical protein KatS3mg115_1130 [Candidatus Poribacteria bacterium]